ncbi:MAG: ribosomal L7Ae/L30e/S12e/Gadd45 family protein [Clostridia bacterium]|nr:ribosomal L7Ae/L30e/S12e/Gadd45 family protein [Clostridia bacterium]
MPESDPRRLAGALGLVRRAGKLAVGAPLVLEALRRGKAAMVILASDASENGAKKILALAAHKQAKVVRCGLDKNALSHAVGVKRAVAAVSAPAEFETLVSTSL